jgi:Na+/proline symporter
MDALLGKLAAMRTAAGPSAGDATAFFPDFSRPLTQENRWALPVLAFLINIGVQWWAFWYPGAEPGGGGYIAQRIFSARDEKAGLLSVLWFNIAHYAVRPWPWILTALAAIVLYPNLAHPETGYMLIVSEHVPKAVRGIVVAGFMAAFMSTVATQLNWGASYLVADFYRRFIHRTATERHYLVASRAATVLLVITSALVAALLNSVGEGWKIVLETGAGTGAVYLLRWYWWRINAWSEIAAMTTALAISVGLHFTNFHPTSSAADSAIRALLVTGVTTAVWLIATFATDPEPDSVLLSFYRKVRPDVRGWRPIAAKAPEVPESRDLGSNLLDWILGCALVYGALFGLGGLLLGRRLEGVAFLAMSVLSGVALYRDLSARWGKETFA